MPGAQDVTIRVIRDRELTGLFGSYSVVVDDTTVGTVKVGQTFDYRTASGRHQIYVSSKNRKLRSATLELDLLAGSVIILGCRSGDVGAGPAAISRALGGGPPQPPIRLYERRY
jgi:hypothetical protein